MPGHVAVVIVGYRNRGDIQLCLKALAAQTHAAFEVVICENGGHDACVALAADLPERLSCGQRVTLICARDNLGYAGGVNLGLSATPDADAWWILNPDTQPDPSALELMLQRLHEVDCEAVGSLMVDSRQRVLGSGYTYNFWTGYSQALHRGRSAHKPIEQAEVEARMTFISGASMLVSRRYVEVAGLMREDYFLYCEETEWCERGRLRGLRLGFAAQAHVQHAQGTTTGAGGSSRDQPRLPVFLMERNAVLMVRDLYPWRWAFVAMMQLLVTTLRLARRRAWRQIGYASGGWWDGVLNRRGRPAWAAS
ncbi:MAG TPA: glycosyltransferase family 2 protein [Caulobacteraceae bacterium]|jgi:hypothetical protein|nr:glycosyltransferase family 2 protein [Caulobacteraceae bacterium]